MMSRLLIDLSCFQAGPKTGGAASYTQKIINEIVFSQASKGVIIYGLYNSTKPFHPIYNIQTYVDRLYISLQDIKKTSISAIIEQHQISTFFIPVAQYIIPYSLSDIRCKTIVVIHDIFDIEESRIGLDAILTDPNIQTPLGRIRRIFNYYSERKTQKLKKHYQSLINFCKQPNVELVTVSEYSKDAIRFLIQELAEKSISVCYSPMKISTEIQLIQNSRLQSLINNNTKYFLLISANRIYKNAYNVLSAFQRISQLYPDYYIVTINYPKSLFKNHISLDTLSESDLEHAYRHSQALVFASFFEGFGYPPIEAMKYGIPVLASNVTSIPEVVGSSAIYFSPLYATSIFHAFMRFFQTDTRQLSLSALEHYKSISTKQIEDTKHLVNDIILKTDAVRCSN